MFKWIILLVMCTSLTYAQDIPFSLVHYNLERHYVLHVPPTYSSNPVPLVMVLHGRGGSGQHIAKYTNFNALADQYGFIALYPDWIEGQWNYVKDVPGYSSLKTNDTSFLLDVIDQVRETYTIDQKRIYVNGFSNGRFMTERLACEHPQYFAAFASVSAAGFGGMPQLCDQPTTISMLLIHGTLDTVVPWDGLGQGNFLMLASVPDSIAFWAGYSSCEGSPQETIVGTQSNKTYVQILKVNCPQNNEVPLYAIHGGGHNWPGKTGISEKIAGQVSTDSDATKVIWDFFQQHYLP